MSIQNELSSEIATALLAEGDRDPERLNNLKELVLKVHSILQEANRGSGSLRSQNEAAEDDQARRAAASS